MRFRFIGIQSKAYTSSRTGLQDARVSNLRCNASNEAEGGTFMPIGVTYGLITNGHCHICSFH